MVEIYSSWVPGFSQNLESLKILKDSGVIDGVECSNHPDHKVFRQAGLKVSFHNPFRDLDTSFANENMFDKLETPQGRDIWEHMKEADCRVIGFHMVHNYLFYLYERFLRKTGVYKRSKPKMASIDEIYEHIVENILMLESRLNNIMPEGKKKALVIETGGYYFFEKHEEYAKLSSEQKKEISEFTQIIRYFNSKEALERLFTDPRIKAKKNIGFLFDVAHVLVASTTFVNKGEFDGSSEDYFREIIKASEGRVFQLHLNKPIFKDHEVIDAHKRLGEDEESHLILRLAREVLSVNPVELVTLEVDEEPDPIAHANLICEQARIIKKSLRI